MTACKQMPQALIEGRDELPSRTRAHAVGSPTDGAGTKPRTAPYDRGGTITRTQLPEDANPARGALETAGSVHHGLWKTPVERAFGREQR
ncbi:hypothetical protein FAGKG844_510020 [Frankia sp. AgKG'84/4]